MAQFKDNKERSWTIDINVAVVKRVKARIQIDLLEAFNGKFLEDLSRDPVRLVDLLYVLCEAQATAVGITDEQFGEAMAGDSILSATDAFISALVDFSPSPRARASLTEIRRLMKEAESKAHDLVDARIKRIDVNEWAEIAVRQGQEKSGASSTVAPAA